MLASSLGCFEFKTLLTSSSALVRDRAFATRLSNWPYMRVCTSKSFFWDQEIFAFCKSSSHHSSGWVPTSSTKVTILEASAGYWTLAIHIRQNEYQTQVSGRVEGRWVWEGAAISMATYPVHTSGRRRHAQGGTSSVEGQASRLIPHQCTYLLSWEQWGISRAHGCGPPNHWAEGAAQEVPSSHQGCSEMVQGIKESPGSKPQSLKTQSQRLLTLWPARWRLSRL